MQTFQDVYQNAKTMKLNCRCCRVCNGVACAGETPGVGGKGTGRSFMRNVEQLKEVLLVLDSIQEDTNVDTSSVFFGQPVSMPIFVAPIAGVKNNYGADISDLEYTEAVVQGSVQAGTMAFSGDGMHAEMFLDPLGVVACYGGVPTIKPWNDTDTAWRLEAAQKEPKVLAIATDVDASGLTILRNSTTPVKSKSVSDLAAMKQMCGDKPFIIKGIMSVAGAKKALAAGADAIVVSNHGGRVLDDCQAPIEVLAEIKAVINDEMKIFIDGGFQRGSDVFKALALGADGVLVGRRAGIAAIGGGVQGVNLMLRQMQQELEETMLLCGCKQISDINKTHVVYASKEVVR
ncbi:MAG: alpha-hydroxy-acid oxidizing protein [Erysipelotrichaceae bacterium]